MVNSLGRITDKLGTAVLTVTLRSFFGVDAVDDSDPRVTYDAPSGRWFALYLQLSAFPAATGTSSIILAVSTSSDPTGSFCRYRIGNPTTETFLQDFPMLGLSDDKVVVSYNGFAFSGDFVGAGYYVLNKADLIGCGTSVARVRVAPSASRFTIHPVYPVGSTLPAFLVMHDTDTTLALVTVTGVPGLSPVTEAVATLSIRSWQMSPPAVQAGSAVRLDTGDDRVLSAVWRVGSLWLAGNEGCVPTGDVVRRSCLRLIEVLTDAPAVRQDLTYGAAGEYSYYPAVQPDGGGNLHVVFTRSSDTAFAGVRATGRLAADPLNTLQPSVDLQAGGGAQTDSSARMGDYSGAALDPTASLEVWVIGEYVVTAGSAAWGTVVARLGFAPSAPSPILTLTKLGAGTGRVSSSPAGIDCGLTCQAAYPSGTVVSLAAASGLGSAFLGWGGGCVGAVGCALTLTADVGVTAVFEQVLQLVVNQTAFRPGDMIELDLRVANPGVTRPVDVYFGALLPPPLGPGCPAGDPVVFLADGFTRRVLTCLSGSPGSFAPLYRGVMLPGSLPWTLLPSFIGFVWPPDVPAGAYTLFLALTVPGALADAVLDAGELFVLAVQTVSVGP
jgi:hypothetical protein